MGQNNDVLIVNESLIFRFPRYRQGDRRVATRSVPVIGHRAEQRVAHSSAHLYVPELGDARRGVHRRYLVSHSYKRAMRPFLRRPDSE